MFTSRSVVAIATLAAVFASTSARSAPQGFQEATVTEAVNQVNVISGTAQRPARINERVQGSEIIRTGPRSRAELKFPDNTIARVGANAAFAFRPDTRAFDLQKGSILFHSPKGMGGGQIRTAAATASVLGTTIIVCATQNGGFKVLVLEGKGKVQVPGGRTMILRAGQLTFILPGGGAPSAVLTFRLKDQVEGAGLVNGFSALLASLDKINEAIERQETLIGKGLFSPTDLMIGDIRADQMLELIINDPNSKPQNTNPSLWPLNMLLGPLLDPDYAAKFLDAYNRYKWMVENPGAVDSSPLDPRHTIYPGELDDPVNFAAFLLALDNAGFDRDSPTGEGPGVNIIQTPDFAFAPLSAGFVAHGIDFDNATVNLSEFQASDIFTFLSLADIFINGSLEIGGFEGIVDFHAFGEIHFPGESSISSLNPGISMVFASGGPLSISDLNFYLPGGFLGLASGQDIDLNNIYAIADQGLRIAAEGAVDINGFTLYPTYGGEQYAIVNGPLEVLPEPANPFVDIFAGGPITLTDVDFNGADVVALTPDTFTLNGYFYARGIDALAGNFDLDLDSFSYLNYVRLNQFEDWTIGASSLYAFDEIALGSFGNLSLDQVNLEAGSGITLSGQDLSLANSSLMTSYTEGGKGITLDAADSLDVLDSYITSAHHLDLLGGNIHLDGSTLTVDANDPLHLLRIDARDSLVANNTTLSASGPIEIMAQNLIDLTGGSITVATPHAIDLRAGNTLRVDGTAFNAQNIRLQAITIALKNVNFALGSQVTLRSGLGMLAPNANQNQPVMPGYVNYIEQVRYNNVLLDNSAHPNISIQKINP